MAHYLPNHFICSNHGTCRVSISLANHRIECSLWRIIYLICCHCLPACLLDKDRKLTVVNLAALSPSHQIGGGFTTLSHEEFIYGSLFLTQSQSCQFEQSAFTAFHSHLRRPRRHNRLIVGSHQKPSRGFSALCDRGGLATVWLILLSFYLPITTINCSYYCKNLFLTSLTCL
jgi:hypothetical protein